MQFTKMHGVGNDYVYVDCFRQSVPADPAALARRMADRHTGIGSDGLVLVCPSPVADARMRIFNADGSEAEMCGNGLRCLAKYAFERQLVAQPDLCVETPAGVLAMRVELRQGRVERVSVDMGEPRLPARNMGLELGEVEFEVTALSMGNPHCVAFVDRLVAFDVAHWGPQIERHPAFPDRTNVEFVEIVDPQHVRQRNWERGSGETLACGSGACAVCVAGVYTGRTERAIEVEMTGGALQIEWDAASNRVRMTGPAAEVFTGEWPDE